MKFSAKQRSWLTATARTTNVSLCFLGILLVLLARQFVAEIGHFIIGFEAVAEISLFVYLGAVLLVRTQPVNRMTLGIVVGFAVAMHAMTYFPDPYLSSDIYRYVWDGMVQHHWISPYRYVPGDPALAWLRAPNQDVFDNINRRDYARTIYPPVAQMVYWVAAFFSPTVEAMKLLMLAFEGLTAWALVQLLERWGRPAAEVLLLLWCPLLVWEIGNAGHIDAAVIAFMTLALLFRAREQPWLTGVFLGCAVMTKFYPLVLVPALWRRRDWRMPAAVLAVVILGYAVYARVGKLVFGFLFTGYTKEEGMESGTRYFPLDYVKTKLGMSWLPTAAFYILCAFALGSIVWWCWRHASEDTESRPGASPAFVRGAGALAFVMMLLFSPHYPWYVIWLVPFMVLAPGLTMYTYVLGLWFGLTTALASPGPKMFLMNTRLYAAVAIAFLVEVALRRWPGLLARGEEPFAVRQTREAGSRG